MIGGELLTHSRIAAFKKCQRLHYFRYIAGIRPRESSDALRFGTAWHTGLDIYFTQGIDQALSVIDHIYADPPAWATTPEAMTKAAVEYQTVRTMLAAYHRHWSDPARPAETRIIEVIESEKAFRLPIINPETGAKSRTFEFAGKRDRIVRLHGGRIAVKESKTTSDSLDADSDYWKRLRLDHQISGYLMAARQDGHDAETVLYDVARKPTIRLKQTETPEEFGRRLAADIADRPPYYFERREIVRLDADIREFNQELWQVAQQMREAENNDRHFRNTAACIGFGRCEYLDWCHNGFNPNNLPESFHRVESAHTELTGD